jgi:hypothetical protein
MKKTILLIALFGMNLSASNYLITLDSKHYDSRIIVNVLIDEKGFNSAGIHKDTGTLFDSNGYDNEGYDINGLGEKVCSYTRDVGNESYVYGLAGYTHVVYLNGNEIGTLGRGKYNMTVGNTYYSLGELTEGSCLCNMRAYETCYQNKR